MKFREENVRAIMEHQPLLVNELYTGEAEWQEELVEEQLAKNQQPILVIHKEQQKYVMNSRFYPDREAQTYAEQFQETKDGSRNMIFGFGNGMIAREVIKQGSEKARYIFYEPCKEAFFYTMVHYDISDILSSKKIILFVDGVNDTYLSGTLSELIKWENIPLTNIYTLPRYKDMYPELYREFFKLTRDAIVSEQMGRNMLRVHAEKLLYNTIHHMRFMFYSTSAINFCGQFPKDMPAILVSAGPSLKKNIKFLKKAKNRAFILCVDTALRRLLAEGIVPDAVMSVDPAKWAAYREDFVPYYKDMMWIVTTNGNAAATGAVRSYRNVFTDGGDVLLSSLFKKVKGEKLVTLATGGSVATSAFSLLYLWNFKTIIFVGQDLALTGDKRYSDSQISAKAESEQKGFTLFEVDEYYGGKVFTREDYYAYLMWFENEMNHLPSDKKVINATEGGALIHGADNMSLEEALNEYAQQEYNIREIIDKVPLSFNDEQRQEIDTILRDYPKRLERFCRLFKEGKTLSERGLKLVQRGNYAPKEMKQLYKRLKEIDKATTDEPEYPAIYYRSIEIQGMVERDMITDTEEEKLDDMRTFEMLVKTYDGLYSGASEMKTISEKMVKSLNKGGWR